ncbi:cytochrome P450 [Lipingzhangella sp. LS1_29]|uniref:Cytochrome P450 n=1 Tax=Lipingzhangella rawalii TaxID=2055835 RepID=A0ABU2H122_9ACTN|nr:cytochrome P450 [Lipingzhangella rawalii]MDS1269007.1 cytochrome P450 [Lipingzhangella rawalii]
MTFHPQIVQTHAGVRAVLSSPEFSVPGPNAPTSPRGHSQALLRDVAWLRNQVSRFSGPQDHPRRRALGVAELDRIPTGGLRAAARRCCEQRLAARGAGPVEVMGALARPVPLDTLAMALGVGAGLAADVACVARVYPPAAEADPEADAAVERLARRCATPAVGERPGHIVGSELCAARIGLLVQACDATAGLIGNAVIASARHSHTGPRAQLLAETLRYSPPVRSTRRVATAHTTLEHGSIAAGREVHLDLAAANRDAAVYAQPHRFVPQRAETQHLAFGFGPRACPGAPHAMALAAGTLDALESHRVVPDQPTVIHEPTGHLWIPQRVEVDHR